MGTRGRGKVDPEGFSGCKTLKETVLALRCTKNGNNLKWEGDQGLWKRLK